MGPESEVKVRRKKKQQQANTLNSLNEWFLGRQRSLISMFHLASRLGELSGHAPGTQRSTEPKPAEVKQLLLPLEYTVPGPGRTMMPAPPRTNAGTLPVLSASLGLLECAGGPHSYLHVPGKKAEVPKVESHVPRCPRVTVDTLFLG